MVARRTAKKGPAAVYSRSWTWRRDRDGARGEGRAALVAHVWVEKERMGKSGVLLVVQWKRGNDAQLFESFASHVARKTHEVVVSGLGSARKEVSPSEVG